MNIYPYDETSIHIGAGRLVYTFEMDISDTYATGGIDLATGIPPFEVHFGELTGVTFSNTGGYVMEYLPSTHKVKIYLSSGLEVGDGLPITISDIRGCAEGWI